jgi:hypothetical protein
MALTGYRDPHSPRHAGGERPASKLTHVNEPANRRG